MMRRPSLRWAGALFLAFWVGCSSVPRLPRVEQRSGGWAVVHIPREAPLQLVVVDKAEFQQAIRRLAREVKLSGSLDTHGRYIWALAMSKSPVLDELKQALGEMVEITGLSSTSCIPPRGPAAVSWIARRD